MDHRQLNAYDDQELRTSYAYEYAAITPRFTGTISVVSSSLVIYVILRSRARLSTIYHRLMFGMSVSALVGSLAIAPTTLLMPAEDVLNDDVNDDRVTKLGNVYTCNIQGFFSSCGMVTMFAYIGMLCIYYACAIGLKMQDRQIRRNVEPWLHTVAIVSGLVFALLPLYFDLYNPPSSSGPLHGWCTVTAYPAACDDPHSDMDCIRGEPGMQNVIDILLIVIISVDFFIIVSCLGLVVKEAVRTYSRPKTILPDSIIQQIYARRRYLDNDLEQGGSGHGGSRRFSSSRSSSAQEGAKRLNRKGRWHAKVIILQASAYIIAFLLGTMTTFMGLTGIVDDTRDDNQLMGKITLFFFPLQGFFNFIIFLGQRIYNYRRVNETMTFMEALLLIFWYSDIGDPVLISRINMVDMHSNRYEHSIPGDFFGEEGEDRDEDEGDVSHSAEQPGTDAACASSPNISMNRNDDDERKETSSACTNQQLEMDDFCCHSYPSGSWSCFDPTERGGDIGNVSSLMGNGEPGSDDEEQMSHKNSQQSPEKSVSLSAEMLCQHEGNAHYDSDTQDDTNFEISPGVGIPTFQLVGLRNENLKKDSSICYPSSDDLNSHDGDNHGQAKRKYYLNYDQVLRDM